MSGGTVIAGSHGSGITLTSFTSNPVSVTGILTSTIGSALYGLGGGTNSWTIVNSGLISSHGSNASGIQLGNQISIVTAGSIANAAGGSIYGAGRGIAIYGSYGSVVNAGSITAGVGAGIYIDQSTGVVANQSGGTIVGATFGVTIHGAGTITNAISATIRGAVAINFNFGIGTVINAGTVTGVTNAGVVLGSIASPAADGVITNQTSGVMTGASYGAFVHGYGTVVNLAGGTIASGVSGVGVGFANGWGTLINAGYILGGTNQDSVRFFGVSNHNRLVAMPNAKFVGNINGGYGVLVLASAASIGTLAGIGTSITNFSTLNFDVGSRWSVTGNASGLGFLVAITGLTTSDMIDLTGFVATSRTFGNNALVLTNALAAHATLHIPGSFYTTNFQIAADASGGTDITYQVVPRSFHWTGGSADWNMPTAWNFGSVPTTIDSALIANAGSNTISIALGESIAVSSVTVAAADALVATGTLTAGSIVDDALLAFVGNHTLNNSPVSLAGTLTVRNGGTMTLGASERITQSGPAATLASSAAGGESIINQGSINAAIAGGSLTIAPLNFLNEGIVIASNETLTIAGTWANTGVIALSGTASLTIGGLVTTANLGTIIGVANVGLTGTLENTGATLSAVGSGQELGTVNLMQTGIVSGGTIADGNGTGFTFNGGTFSNVTYHGELNIAASSGQLNIENGLTATGPIMLTGAAAQLKFLGNQTLDDVTLVIGNASQAATIQVGSTSSTFYFGTNTTIVSSIAGALANLTVADGLAVLDGTLEAIAQDGTFAITGNTFENDGAILVGDGEVLEANASIAAGAGTIELATHATVRVAEPVAASQTLSFDDATGTLALSDTAGFGATILGFSVGNTIDLTNIVASSAVWQAGQLVIFDETNPVATLALTGDYSGARFHVDGDGEGGSAITVSFPPPCFAAGTRIMTTRGSILIERLREGDTVLTAGGKREQIRWIGYRHVDFRRSVDRERALPIRVATHALGHNRPKRPLFLSADHSIFLNGVLIPVKFLMNGSTIRQIDVREVTYFHIELDRHELLLAEGMPTESYLETGGRNAFANANYTNAVPDEAQVATIWQSLGFAPLVGNNGELDRAQRMVALQATMLGAA